MKKIAIIPSKSYAHRALIAASFSETETEVICSLPSKDILATRGCMAAIRAGENRLPCGESGSTLRFLLPVMGALGRDTVFLTEGRLAERPLSPLREQLEAHGMTISPTGTAPVTASGQLSPGRFTIAGNVSSQFISGLMFALPLLAGDSEIRITGSLQSAGYVDITRQVIADFGITIQEAPVTEEDRAEDVCVIYRVPGGQTYRGPAEYQVEGDWSSAAFWMTAAAIGREPLQMTGLKPDSLQGDRQMVQVIEAFGGRVTWTEDGVIVWPSALCGAEIDVSAIPDLAPEVGVLGAAAVGETRIVNGGRLRLKESDRIRTICQTLRQIGVRVQEQEEGMVITGRSREDQRWPGGSCDSFNDHRIAMMAAVLSLITEEPVSIGDWQAVGKSYPGFFEDMRELELDGNVRLI